MTAPILVLVGGGHAHIQVVTSLPPTPGVTRVLISDSPTSVYSGMLPSVVAGLTPGEHATVNLPALCAAHGFSFIHASVSRLVPSRNRVFFRPHATSIHTSLIYSHLSLNVGSSTKPVAGVPLEYSHTLPILIPTRPIANLEPAIRAFEKRIHPHSSPHVVVIGAGAAGIELVLAVSSRLRAADITLVSRADTFESQFGRRPGHAVATELRGRGVKLVLGRSVVAASRENSVISLDDGSTLPFALAIVASGAAPHKWMSHLGLPTDQDGWILANPTLQSTEFANVFAAGDCVSFGERFGANFPPKAGVYAVRQGPILTHNLAVAVNESGKMKEYSPQPSFLSLLSTGDGRAIGSKYGVVFTGSWVYRLKSFIDEAWQDRFRVSGKIHSPTPRNGKLEHELFEGSPLEGAALLQAADDINLDDSFDKQLMVLRRMDADEDFREKVVHLSTSG